MSSRDGQRVELAHVGCSIGFLAMTVMAMSGMGTNDEISGSRGICTVRDSLGEGRVSPFSASQAFEQIIPITKFHTPTMKALAAHYNPLEGLICGLFMTSNCNRNDQLGHALVLPHGGRR